MANTTNTSKYSLLPENHKDNENTSQSYPQDDSEFEQVENNSVSTEESLTQILEKNYIPDTDEAQKENHSEEHGFLIINGCFYKRETYKQKTAEIPISNCVFKVLYHLPDSARDSVRLVYIQRNDSEKFLILVKSSELRPEIFEVILKSHGCTFWGDARTLKRIFALCMANEEDASEVQKLGWNAELGIFALGDAIYDGKDVLFPDELGIIKLGPNEEVKGSINNKDKLRQISNEVKPHKLIYLPGASNQNRHSAEWGHVNSYNYRPGQLNFSQFASLYCKAYGQNGYIGTIFLIASIFRDIIMKKLSFFPYLFLFGDLGTGKSNFVKFLLTVFGTEDKGLSLGNTTMVGLTRKLSQFSNGLIYAKEYSYILDLTLDNILLSLYDGVGRNTGQKSMDNRTVQSDPTSALILDGNQTPTRKSAVASRVIILSFQTYEFSDFERDAFIRLDDHSKSGFHNVLIEILQLRNIVETRFTETFEETFKEIRKNVTDSNDFDREQFLAPMSNRFLNHAALLLTIHKLASSSLSLPFSYSELKEFVYETMNDHHDLLRESNETSIWWQAFAFSVGKGYLYEYQGNGAGQFRIKRNENGLSILQIKIDRIWPLYGRYCRDNGYSALDLSSMRMLLTSSSNKDLVRSNQKGRKNSYTDKVFGSCYQFHISRITDPESGHTSNWVGGVEMPF